MLPAAIAATGMMGQRGAKAANAANAQMAHNQMQFQERMSRTAYQRQVADMKAAGINPMLSARMGGASTPGGQTAVMQNTAKAGIESAMNMASLKNMQATARKTNAEANVIEGTGTRTAEAKLQGILEANTSQNIKNREAGELLRARLLKMNFSVGRKGQRFTGSNAYQMKVLEEFRQMGYEYNRISDMSERDLQDKSPQLYQILRFKEEWERAAAEADKSVTEADWLNAMKAAGFTGKVLQSLKMIMR
jgi:hypothetical protein